MPCQDTHTKPRYPAILWRLLAVLAITLPLTLTTPPPPVQAGGASDLVPFLGILIGWGNRNRVYRTANAFIADKQAYYDALHAKALEQLAAREASGLRDSQVAAFVKVVALIERERQATIDFAESEKKAARDEFIEIIEDEITNRMLASTPATRVLSAFSDGVRTSQGLIDHALNKLAGGGGVLAEIQRARRIASRMTIAGQLIGGKMGEQIRGIGKRVVDLINKPTGEIEAGLAQVRDELGDLGALVADLQAQGYRPTASEIGQEILITLVTGDEGSPAVQAIVDMLVAKSDKRGDFRERARDIVLGDAAARCAAKAQMIQFIVFRLEMDNAGVAWAENENDLPPACEAIDLTALTEDTVAVSPGTAPEPETEAASPTATATAEPVVAPTPTTAPSPTAQPAATRPAPEDLDPCAVMPAGGQRIQADANTCVATFASDPGGRVVQINLLYPHVVPENACTSLQQPSDYRTVNEAVPIGLCGYRMDTNYQGEKTGAYTGWSVNFILDRFKVRVATNEEHPANKDWVEGTATEIEQSIRAYLALDGDG